MSSLTITNFDAAMQQVFTFAPVFNGAIRLRRVFGSTSGHTGLVFVDVNGFGN